MPLTNVYNMEGEVVTEVELNPSVFGTPVNAAVLHQVVTAQLLNRRQGNASTKTRSAGQRQYKEAVSPKRNGARSPGKHSRAAPPGWWRGLWPASAPVSCVGSPEDAPSGYPLCALR